MARSDEFERARARAEAKYGFIVHASIFLAVNLLLLIINLFTSPGRLWFIWPMIGWGIAVALHAARAFLIADKTSIMDTLTERELTHSGAEKNDAGL